MRIRLFASMALTRSVLKRWSLAPSLFQQNGFHSSTHGMDSSGFLFLSENGLRYRVREAKPHDISSLNQCNRQNLPENYHDEFYENQLARWPDLSLIAESENQVIGYGLGRIETIQMLNYPNTATVERLLSSHEYPQIPTYQGHIVSIAINPACRGHNVAFNIMQILHHRFATSYAVDSSSLYCRPSNKPAMSLYADKLGYGVTSIIPRYYVDSEDAYFMTAEGLIAKYNPPKG